MDLQSQRRTVFQYAFDRWRETGKWPLLKEAARALAATLDVDAALRGVGWPWVSGDLNRNSPIALRLPAIVECNGSQELTQPFLVAVRHAADVYFDQTRPAEVTQQQLVDLGLTPQQAHNSMLLLQEERIWDSIVGRVPGDMIIHIGNEVRKLRGVADMDDYLRRTIDDYPSKYHLDSQSPSASLFGKRQRRAFIMMWLAQDNPHRQAVADTVRREFSNYGIQAEHAMDVEHEGLVTEMILERIREADFLFADMTGERPSVYYEIGYAHALGKPVMMYQRRGSRIHFDLAGHNAPEYDDVQHLGLLLARRLAERLGKPRLETPA